MNSTKPMSRKNFLRSFLPRMSEASAEGEGGMAAEAAGQEAGPDYLASLPPEFSGALLRQEVARLGGDPDKMDPNDMAALILRAMCGQRL